MDRRRFLLTSLAGALAAPLGAGAQQTGKVPHIGVILPGSAGVSVDTVAAIKEGLRSHGLVEGRSITIDWYFADGKYDQLPAATEKLLKDGATLLVVGGTTPAMIVNKTTVSKPIVFAGVSDLVGAGLASSLARPGGNATGLATAHEEAYAAKALELLKEAVPSAVRTGVLHNPGNPFNVRFVSQVDRAAAKLGVKIEAFAARTDQELDAAIAALAARRPDTVVVASDPFLTARVREVVTAIGRLRLPAMFGFKEHVTAGGLMSYGANRPEMFRRAATYVDKILKGAKPADPPIEQPTKFELVINLKTAKALGLTIPPSLLARADQVIE